MVLKPHVVFHVSKAFWFDTCDMIFACLMSYFGFLMSRLTSFDIETWFLPLADRLVQLIARS
jgi:hypothetical protein